MSNTPDIDIRPDHWKIIRAILQEHVPQYEIWAFGSRAKWTAKEFSDLDLAIMTEEPLPKEISAALADAFDESDLPYKVDVVDWAETTESFQEAIKKDHISLTPEMAAVFAKCSTIKVSKLLRDEVLFIGDGYRAKNSELSDTGIPFARAGNVNKTFLFDTSDKIPFLTLEKVGNKQSQPGDVVFTSKGTVGRFAYVQNDTPNFVYSPQICFWRVLDTQQINPRWLFYWMQGSEFYGQYKGASGQTDMAEYVSLRDQRAMHITIPPLSEQQAVAHILGTLDDKIELNLQMNETLESMARAVFKDLFLDFELTSIEDYAELSTESWKMSHSGTINYVDLSGVKWGTISDVKRMGFDEAPSRARKILKPGDSIIGVVRPGNGSYAFIKEEGLTGSTGFAVIRPKISCVAEFVYCATTSKENIERLSSLADGGAYPAVSPAQIISSPAPRVDDETLHGFHKNIEPLFTKISLLQKEIQTLAQLRDTLLPKLVSGELRIKDTEKFVAEAV